MLRFFYVMLMGELRGIMKMASIDVPAVSREESEVVLSILICKAYGEKLMKNKLGGIVMIEPETGEILCNGFNLLP